jgi:uncharacterized iron-regulated membrane protein
MWMWLHRRRRDATRGATVRITRVPPWLLDMMVVLGVLLPTVGVSLLAIFALDWAWEVGRRLRSAASGVS